MKKSFLAMLLVLGLLFAGLTGCGPGAPPPSPPPDGQQAQEPRPEPANVNVGGLKGPTGIALVGMADSARRGEARHNYNVTFDTAPDVIQGKIISGELDIAAMPTNLAALLYNRTGGEITMIAMNRLKVLFIMQAPGEDISSFEDLRGKTLFTAGQGSMQEYVLNFFLREAGLDPETDLNIEFLSEHAHVVALMLDGRADAAFLPQPFVTTLIAQNPEITRAIDIDAEWEALTGAELAMSCLVVRSDFLAAHPDVVRDFLEDFAASARFAMTNIDQAAALVGEFDIAPEHIARQAIPYSNIASVTGEEMKAAALAYLRVLYEQNPAAVGGSMPDERFFFTD